MEKLFRIVSPFALVSSLGISTANAEVPSLSIYGTPGLVETPTAYVLPESRLAFTVSSSKQTLHNTATFQFLPWAFGNFRYSIIDEFDESGVDRFDRSFDLQFLILEEAEFSPAIGVGLRDFLGTGLYSSEYMVVTKEVMDGLVVSGGIGWGRLAGRNSFGNPLSILGFSKNGRETETTGSGGQVEAGRWFQGKAALFGGIDWAIDEKLSFQIEYSPDTYVRETSSGVFDYASPINLGVIYKTDFGVETSLHLIGGETVGLQLNYTFDPMDPAIPGGRESAPEPILSRTNMGYLNGRASASTNIENVLKDRLRQEGLRMDWLRMSDTDAEVAVHNIRWNVQAQAAGRAARVLANTLPARIEGFTVVFQEKGVPISSVTTNRADLEDLQYDYEADWRTRARADVNDAYAYGTGAPKFDYSFRPYAATSFFDPQSPIRVDFGAQFRASYQAAPGLTFDARLRYPLVGNLGDTDRDSDSVIQKVRSESFLYAREADLEINQLTAEYIWRPAPEMFARVAAGYLENQYGGISSEILWSPIDSRFALGAELNYVKQRDFDMLLGFQDYDVVTGHASAYYDLGNGFHSQVDIGRYLAGDWGGTLTVKREFNNGVKVGGYFTLTDVPFDDFGEGAFDKGLSLEIPLSFFTGQPSRRVLNQKIQPLLRDGGARLNVQNRLYPLVREYRGPELSDGWGRYLR